MRCSRGFRVAVHLAAIGVGLLLLCLTSFAESESDAASASDAASTSTTAAAGPGASQPRVLFVLMCQSQLSAYHKERCAQLRRHIEAQMTGEVAEKPFIALALAEELVEPRVETFFYLPMLVRNHTVLSTADFVFFCHEETRLNLAKLLGLLDGYEANQPVFLGSPLQDHGLYIVHHFNPSKLMYPFLYCGFILSRGLVSSLTAHFHADKSKLEEYEFRIDPIYELALLISNELHIANMTAVESMCARAVANNDNDSGCVTWTTESFRLPECSYVRPQDPQDQSSQQQQHQQQLLSRTLFAVKTHQANFDTVLPVVRDTWANQTRHIRYYADVDDPAVPAIACGVPNTARGHCDKLNRILHLALNATTTNSTNSSSTTSFDWFVICDDDTLLSVPRLARLLACYDRSVDADADDHQKQQQPIVIGEKYGYLSSDGLHGYPYPTGGSGFALNRAALTRLVDSPGVTRCGSAESPDDMSLGVWLRSLGVPLVHWHLFHQARPVEYAPELLAAQLPVSFHKHYEIDPRQVYAKYLGGGDSVTAASAEKSADASTSGKDEL